MSATSQARSGAQLKRCDGRSFGTDCPSRLRSICGYNRSVVALEFHHLDPKQKDFGVAQRGITRAIEQVRREVEKCVLLCSNCHAEVERGVTKLPEAIP